MTVCEMETLKQKRDLEQDRWEWDRKTEQKVKEDTV